MRRSRSAVVLAAMAVAAVCTTSAASAGGPDRPAAVATSADTGGAASSEPAGSSGDAPSGVPDVPDDADRDATLRLSYVALPTTLDPYQEPNQATRAYNMLLSDRLVMLDRSGTTVMPMLATDWEFSADGSALTLHLRDDATFSDGSAITADAVKFSIERAKTVEGSLLAGRLAAVDTVDVEDDLTVVLNLAAPTTTILYDLASTAGSVFNPAVVDDTTDWTNGPPPGAASGAYDVVEFVPGQTLVVERSEREYWDPVANPIHRIEFQAIPESATALNALASGQLDVAYLLGAEVDSARSQIEAAGMQLVESHGAIMTFFQMNSNSEALGDVRVRQAIAYGVDWQTIVENVLANNEIFSDFQLFYPDEMGYLEDGTGYTYDVERARSLLEEAGVADLTIRVGVYNQLYQRVAEAANAQLADLGIELEISVVAPKDAAQNLRTGVADVTLGSLSAERPVSLLMNTYFTSDTRGRLAGEDVPQLQELLAAVTDPTATDEETAAAAQAVTTFAAEQMWFVPLSFSPILFGTTENVHGLDNMELGVLGIFNLRYVYVTG